MYMNVALLLTVSVLFWGELRRLKVCDNEKSGILEIKCPYRTKEMTIKDAVPNIPDYICRKNGETFSFKRTHSYLAQVQRQLMVTGCSF